MRIYGASQRRSTSVRVGVARFFSRKILVTSGSTEILRDKIVQIFRSSSAVERSPVKRLVTGSIPVSGARKSARRRRFFAWRAKQQFALRTGIERFSMFIKITIRINLKITRGKRDSLH